MKARLEELLDIDHVLGIMLFSHKGDTLFEKFGPLAHPNLHAEVDWAEVIQSFDGIQEGEFIFENKRLYLKKTARGYLLVVMESYASAALLRLSCDAIVASTGNGDGVKSRGVRGFFKLFK
jgi:hypothetical protein